MKNNKKYNRNRKNKSINKANTNKPKMSNKPTYCLQAYTYTSIGGNYYG